TGSSGATQNGTLTGDGLPTFGGTTDDGTRSPAGGSFMHFEGDSVFLTGSGGRVDVGDEANRATWLHPVLGKDASIGFWIRTEQTGGTAIWNSPAVTGNEHTGCANDVFYVDLTPARGDNLSHFRGAAGNVAAAESSSPICTGQLIHVLLTLQSEP